MPRATWSGAISFGLVNVPVKAYTAMHDHAVHFHQLEKGTGAHVRYQKVSEKSGHELDADHIESAYEVSQGRYVVVDPDELDALRPERTRTIDIGDFVDLKAIDPIFYERTYWLAPDGEPAAKAYGLLVTAMQADQRAGVGTVIMHNKQYLAAIRPLDGALAMSTMRFADEVVPRSSLDAIPKHPAKPAAKELKLARQIINSLAADWEPDRYHDTYTEQLRDLIDRKANGEQLKPPAEDAAPKADVLDLTKALEASIAAANKKSGLLPSFESLQDKFLEQKAAQTKTEPRPSQICVRG